MGHLGERDTKSRGGIKVMVKKKNDSVDTKED